MNVLAIDLSTDACSVAVSLDETVRQRIEPGQRPSRLVLQLVDGLLAESDIDLKDIGGIAFGHGPGAFTGLRIAAGVAQGLALGLDIPVVGVSSLQAMAQVARQRHGVRSAAVMLDARMNEVYAGYYVLDGDGFMQPAVEDKLLPPAHYQLPGNRPEILAGAGWTAYPELEPVVSGLDMDPDLRPEAGAIAALAFPRFLRGEGGAPETAIPVYLRDKVAWQGTP